ncbi:MAG: SHOCT domain-containing protein [Myxococcota bacterium]|nr:SHOCT domain-containing protein [Myxococcota bacterium]
MSLLWLAAPDAAASRSATIRNVPPTPHFAPDGTPLVDVAAAIKLAMGDLQWRVVGEVPGSISASLVVRRHEAVVTIGYDESNYWIDYQDSVNLNYSPNDLTWTGRARRPRVEGPRIHPNYNVWVSDLGRRIAIRARTPPDAEMADTAVPDKAVLIADELEKLAALLQRGLLTQEEFDQQKAKLLAQ